MRAFASVTRTICDLQQRATRLFPARTAGNAGEQALRTIPHLPGLAAISTGTGGLIVLAIAYFLLAKVSLTLASLHPSASPIWPPSGFALAAFLLWGPRVWPSIYAGAFLANVTTLGTIPSSLAIGGGNTFEALVTAHLLEKWSSGAATFATPSRAAKFVLLSFLPGPMASATIGVGSLYLVGLVDPSKFQAVWLTWWLGDAGGLLLVTPVMVLWAKSDTAQLDRKHLEHLAALLAGTAAVGLIAFSPIFQQTPIRSPLGFLAVGPLLWAALRHQQRDTATTALVLSCFAIWGTLANGGPFARSSLNDSFLLVLTFVISTAVPSLVLSADVCMRRRTESTLRQINREIENAIGARTSDLASANQTLLAEIEHRSRVQAEHENQRRQLIGAQRLANLGSWVWDIQSNEVVWSDQLYEIFGVAREAFGGTFEFYLSQLHADDRARVESGIKEAFRSGQGFRLEERIVRPDGEIRYLQSSGEIIKDARGEPVQMIGICQDVTERHRAQVELENARDQLAQAQKMEALGQLTGSIAHDFNNLLMIVSGHAQMLKRGLADAKQLQSTEAITSAAKRGESLTRQLLTFARRQRLSPTVMATGERIEGARNMLASSLRDDIQFACDLEQGLWPIEVDLAEFELALVNLAVNARDAMPNGGKLTLSARNVRVGAKGERQAGDYVVLAISDTGTGIAPDVLAKIFDPFFTTKPVGKGTGLGLSQVHGFVHQSRGSVEVKSEIGRGTTIILYLPRSFAPVQSNEQDAARPEPAAPAGGTVLLVEDNAEVGRVTAALIEQLGYQVLHVMDASSALERLNGGQKCALLFSDIVMPGSMNGLELAQAVKARFGNVAILLTSGYSDAVLSAQSQFPILRKPFEVGDLDRAIRAVLASGFKRHSAVAPPA